MRSDGFTMIPNDLLHALCQAVTMKNAERCVLLYLVRQSYGFNRQDTSTFGSVRSIATATGLQPRTIQTALKRLKSAGYVMKVSEAVGTKPAVYRVTCPDPEITPDLRITPDQEIICRPDPQITPRHDPQITPYKEKKRQRTNNPPSPPPAHKKWTADKLYFKLGGRGTIPPFVQGKWLSIADRSDEDIDEAVRRVTNFANPRARFLEQFDDDGQDLIPGWAKRSAHSSNLLRENTEEETAKSNARIIADFEKWQQSKH